MSDFRKFDYSAFEDFHALRAAKYGLTRLLASKYLWGSTTMLVIIIVAVGMVSASTSQKDPATYLIVILIFLTVGIIFLAVDTYFHHYNNYTASKLVMFANSNELKIKQPNKEYFPDTFKNHVNSNPIAHLIGDAVEIPIHNKIWEMYVIEYKYDGKFVVFRSKLKKPLTNIAIDNVNFRGLPNRPHDLQAVKLEGKFHENFTVYFPKGAQSIALSVIDPILMEVLMHNLDFGDIEINDDSIFVLGYQNTLHKEKLPRALASLQSLEKLLT